jgi:hypothetical protein
MAKRGKTPSLISGQAGQPKFAITGATRKCHRCGSKLAKGSICIEVKVPGTLSKRKNYCPDCFSEVLDKTLEDINNIKKQLSMAYDGMPQEA